MNIKDKIIEILEQYGIIIEDDGADVDLQEYGMDSLTYIMFICDVEECFSVQLPDEYLAIDGIVSLNTMVEIIEDLIRSCKTIQ